MQKRTLVKNTLILTSAGLITKALGFVYRIYMANKIGALGMGLYGLIVPIYVLCWSISCSGFTTTISREVAMYSAKGDIKNQRKVLKIGTIMSVAIGIALSLILYIFASFIAKKFYNEPGLMLPIKVLSLAIPFMAGGSCIRGYFFGTQSSVVPAISQLLEQSTRMVVVFLFANVLVPLGQMYAVTLCILGIVVSEIVSFIFVYVCYKKTKSKTRYIKNSNISSRQIATTIILMALPLTLNRVSGSILSTLENILIPIKLQEFGLTNVEAIESFGKITGMAIPIIYFPSALLTSISISLVPAISESISVGNKNSIDYLIRKTILFTIIIGSLSASVFTCFSMELGMVIFKQDLSSYLFIFGLMCPLLYMQIIMGGILNGLSEQLFIFKNSLISSLTVIFFIYFFMPKIGMNAFLIGLFVSTVITSWLAIRKISQKSNTNTKIHDMFYLPILSAVGATLITKVIYKTFIHGLFGNVFSLFLGLITISVLYFIFIIFTGTIKFSEFMNILKGAKTFLPKNNIMI